MVSSVTTVPLFSLPMTPALRLGATRKFVPLAVISPVP